MGFLQPDVGHGGGHREVGLSGAPKAVTIHHLRHARAAVAAAAENGCAVCLLSAPNAAASAGAAWFAAVVDEARRENPAASVTAILDCGDFAGYALGALRHGLTAIRYDGPTFSAVDALAAEYGATVTRDRPHALDLGSAADDEAQAFALCRQWLADDAGSG
ncbi:MAG: hypothetical protein MJE12_20765 [Alphaproteobacteria bacterium]|nr:hypothetical protein [Alphaproteobacteria bacterium]